VHRGGALLDRVHRLNRPPCTQPFARRTARAQSTRICAKHGVVRDGSHIS